MTHTSLAIKKSIAICVVTIFLFLFLFLSYFLALNAPTFLINNPFKFVWIIFAFITGFFMVGSRSIYPVALNISSHATKNSVLNTSKKIAVFSIATLVVLSLFGILFPSISKLPYFHIFDFSKISIYMYVLFGFIAYIISLSNLKVFSLDGVVLIKDVKAFLASPTPIVPVFTFVLAAFFGEIIPSTWLLFLDSGLSQNIMYGLILLLSHAFGRIFMVFIISAISSFGINATDWLISRKNSFKKALNVTTFIFGLLLIQIGLNNIALIFSLNSSSIFHFINGGWLMLLLLLTPLWVKFFIEEQRIYGSSSSDIHSIRLKIIDIEDEARNLEIINKHSDRGIIRYIEKLAKKIDELKYISKILESSLRHGHSQSIRENNSLRKEEKNLRLRLIYTVAATILSITIISFFI